MYPICQIERFVCVCAGVCAGVCVQACVHARARARMCSSSSSRLHSSLSLSLYPGFKGENRRNQKSDPKSTRVTQVTFTPKPLPLQRNCGFCGGFGRRDPSLRPAPKGGPGAGGCGHGPAEQGIHYHPRAHRIQPSQGPVLPIGGVGGILEGIGSGPGGSARQKPGSRGGGRRTG
jgi:hypothetical protein